LLLVLFLVTFVSVSALAWFGWKVLRQERLVEAQRAQVRLEETADRMAATLRGTLAETGESLGAWLNSPPSGGPSKDGLLLLLSDDGLAARPVERLLFSPRAAALPEARPAIFSEAEAAEFLERSGQGGRGLRAAGRIEQHSQPRGSANPSGAMLRNGGQAQRSRAAPTPGWRALGRPLPACPRIWWRDMRSPAPGAGRRRALRPTCWARWGLTRPVDSIGRKPRDAGIPEEAPGCPLSDAADAVERRTGARGPGGLVGRSTFLVIWRGAPRRRAALIAPPTCLNRILGAMTSGAPSPQRRPIVAGRKTRSATPPSVPRQAQIPWTIYVTAPTTFNEGGFLAQQRFLAIGCVMVLFLVVGAYHRRGHPREAGVSYAISFVSAVSHEFRSPLTSIRQLSEILADGRALRERAPHYDTLVQETSPLQRLMGALLNFRRMEAGANYR
jgi:hypothetical protein